MINNGNESIGGGLPISNKRRESKIVYETVPVSDGKVLQSDYQNKDNFKQQITNKAMDSIPDLINLAKTYMDIRKTAGQAEAQVRIIREQGEYLQKQADAIVKTEIARRDTITKKGDAVQEVLKDLYGSLSTLQAGDDVKKELIGLVNRSIQGILDGNNAGHA